MNAGVTEIRELPIAEIEKLVTEYPWFSYARRVLMLKLSEGGREHMEVCLKKCSAFIPSRKEIYEKTLDKAEMFQESFPVIDFEEINKDIDDIRALGSEDKKEESKPQYIILGGDYFTKEDFAELDDIQPFRIGAIGSADNSQSIGSEGVVKNGTVDDSDIFYTETLAKIYAEQGYYEEAMKVYSKLILLYPEKSAYFATLVSEVKSKNN